MVQKEVAGLDASRWLFGYLLAKCLHMLHRIFSKHDSAMLENFRKRMGTAYPSRVLTSMNAPTMPVCHDSEFQSSAIVFNQFIHPLPHLKTLSYFWKRGTPYLKHR